MPSNRTINSFASETSRLRTLAQASLNQKIPTPYMITDKSCIKNKRLEFEKELPNVSIYYAVKAFSDNEVIRCLNRDVEGYDVASITEIQTLLNMRIKPERLMFSNPVKSATDIALAYKQGVRKFAFQSHEELKKLKSHAPGSMVYARIKVSDQLSELSFSSKFGCNSETAAELLLKAKKMKLKPIGLTFHVGGQASVDDVWPNAIKTAARVIAYTRNKGLKLTMLNLGGGFPVRYSRHDPSLSEVADVINTSLVKHIPHDVKIVAEPGRFLVADSSAVITTIIGIEKRNQSTWLFLDVGAFQAFVEIFEFGYLPQPVYSVRHIQAKTSKAKLKKYVLTGPSCDSYDTLSNDIYLPDDLSTGDQLLIGMSGAYTVVYGSNFNGFKVPERVFI